MFTRRALTVALGASLTVITLSACSMQGMDMGGSSSASPSSSSPSASFNDQDVMFAQMMTVHHSQAIEMAEMVLAKEDIDPRVTELAEQIRAAQAPEIETLDSWLQEWGADDSMGGMDHDMGGMEMSEEDMAALEAASGTQASRLFLEQMTEHHMGAIDMAQDQVENGQNEDAVALAEKIIADQQAEIETMEEILSTL